MCGFVGAVSAAEAIDPDVLAAVRDSMSHRGPDAAGMWLSIDRRVGLAHRRLAVIDLNSNSNQPMVDGEGRVALVLNGEIYNYLQIRRELEGKGHRFRTRSDTEVLLESYKAWGAGCLARLRGMFAFGLFDSRNRTLLLARDRAGEKPLFYHVSPAHVLFASELKALLPFPSVRNVVDHVALESYLAYGYVPGELCMVRGVRKLGPGQALQYEIESGRVTSWRYWALPSPRPTLEAQPGALADELEALLTDSVREQLEADVPLGIMLSGGLDSSLITAVAAKVSSGPVKTFTVSIRGDSSYDEAGHARRVARYFDTDHTELVLERAPADLISVLARQYDEPMCDSSMIPTYLISTLIRKSATVALSGDGADELFGGYPRYPWVIQQAALRRLVPGWLGDAIGTFSRKYLPLGLPGRNYLLGFPGGEQSGMAYANLFFDAESRRRLVPALNGHTRHKGRPEETRARLYETERGLPGAAMAVDFQTYLPDDILVKVDRASMLASLELRCPWLDHRIVEFAFSRVPNALRATARRTKVLPQALARRVLPACFDRTRKHGFTVPLSAWFKGGWENLMQEVLLEGGDVPFDRRTVEQMFRPGRLNQSNSERLFSLVLFQLWRRAYNIGLP